MKIVALVKDLFFMSRIQEAASTTEFVSKFDKVQNADLVFLDLEVFGAEGIPNLRQNNPNARIIGFVSHVNIELKKKAEEEGIVVMPRSEFAKRLKEFF